MFFCGCCHFERNYIRPQQQLPISSSLINFCPCRFGSRTEEPSAENRRTSYIKVGFHPAALIPQRQEPRLYISFCYNAPAPRMEQRFMYPGYSLTHFCHHNQNKTKHKKSTRIFRDSWFWMLRYLHSVFQHSPHPSAVVSSFCRSLNWSSQSV